METLNIEESPPWTELPPDLTADILQRLDVLDRLGCAQLVCTAWWKACQNPAMWRIVNLMNFCRCNEHCNILCRRVVDLSQGQLISLTIGFFIDAELLDYIADRSPQLRCLAFPFEIWFLSEAAMNGVIAKLPNLEELHCLKANVSCPGDAKIVRIFWPLNSFKLDVCRAHSVGPPKCWWGPHHIELVYTDEDYNGLEANTGPYTPVQSILLHRIWFDGEGLGKKRQVRENYYEFDTVAVIEEMISERCYRTR